MKMPGSLQFRGPIFSRNDCQNLDFSIFVRRELATESVGPKEIFAGRRGLPKINVGSRNGFTLWVLDGKFEQERFELYGRCILEFVS